MQFRHMSYIILMMLILASQKNSQQSGSQFETVPKSVAVNTTITEASGIASSRLNAGHLWVHEDGGKPAQMLLLRSDGTLVKSLVLKEADNIDWEDMAIAKGPDPTLDYLYIADIGDNL